MKKNKTLWAGIGSFIATMCAIVAFFRGDLQRTLAAIAIAAWGIWAVIKCLIPYVQSKLDARDARKIREYYEAEERKLSAPATEGKTGIVLLRHVNHRITAHLQSAYPDSTWEWRVDDPEALVANGGTGRIQVYGAADFNYADVTVNTNAEINCEMLKLVPISEIQSEEPSEEEAKPEAQNPINPQVWYEQKGRAVLENLITDLNSRGHSSLSITESGDVIITQADKEIKKASLEAMPEKVYWRRLAKVFQSEGIAANVTDNAMVLSW